MRSSRITNSNLNDKYATPSNGSCCHLCVCVCVCMRGYPCAYAWVEFNHCMRLCSWCHFWLKEVKESLHHVPLGATQEFLIKAIVSKPHKLHCREQERVCAARLCIYSEVSASVYSAPWYTVLFFRFVFFLLPFSLCRISFQVYFG